MKYILIYWTNIHQVVSLFADTGTEAADLLRWIDAINAFTKRNNGDNLYYLVQRHD